MLKLIAVRVIAFLGWLVGRAIGLGFEEVARCWNDLEGPRSSG